MTGSTIDHLVSVTMLVAVLLVCMTIYNQTLSDAIAYQRNHQVAIKANDLIDSTCRSTGLPEDWGQSCDTPLAFGVQQPRTGGFTLSPFTPLRIIDSENTVVYDDSLFNNASLEHGASLFLPVDMYVNYATVARLLGVNGSYGFQLTITPTLRVSVTEVTYDPFFRFKVEVNGPGGALGGALVNGNLFYASWVGVPTPAIDTFSSNATTDLTGAAFLNFSLGVSDLEAYSLIVYANLRGVVGVGFCSNSLVQLSYGHDLIVPLITDCESGKVTLVHHADITGIPPSAALFYNMTIYILSTPEFSFVSVAIENSTGTVNIGQPAYLQIPASEPGILLIGYRTIGLKYGILLVPWGINTLGTSVTFGGNPLDRDWVATELRQVNVKGISYQVRLAVWRE